MVRTQFDKVVKTICTNNGTKFLNNNCQMSFNDLGIIHKKSCTYTPKQNGVVERRPRTILQMAKSLLFQSGTPIDFWGEAVLHATYILNRLPYATIKWKTSYELLFKRKASYSQIKCF